MSKTLHPLWSQKHKDYMRKAVNSTIAVAHGAVRAGKTIDNICCFAKVLSMCPPDKIHLATGSTLANAKLNIGTANGFGLENIFRGRCKWGKYRDNEALFITIKGHEYVVIFAGGGKADSFKKIRGNSYGCWIATEIQLHDPSFIQEAMNRQLAAKVRKIFWDLNPSSPAHWIYKDYIDKFAEQYGDRYTYEEFTIRDNLSITPERLADIERQYEPGSIWYRRDILGERCIAEGLVYPTFTDDNIIKHGQEPECEGDFYVSCDYGIQNATVFLLWQKVKGKSAWFCSREYYYSGRDEHKQKTDGELADDLTAWLAGIQPKRVIIDPSATSFIKEIQKHGYTVQKAKNEVLTGIAETSQLFLANALLFSEDCKNTIDEFGIYAWDTHACEKGQDAPVKQNDHGADATRYMVHTMHLLDRYRKATNPPVDSGALLYL